MKNVLMFLLAIGLLGACSGNSNKTAANTESEPEAISVDSFLAAASNLIGKEVVVKGKVDHVCKHGGKRVHLFSSCPAKNIQVESADTLVVFSPELEGSEIYVTGIVAEIKIDMAYVQDYEQKIQTLSTGSDSIEVEQKKGEGHHISLEKIEQWKKDIEASANGYISNYYIEATSYQSNIPEAHCCDPINDTLTKDQGCCSGDKNDDSEVSAKPCQK